VTTAAPAHWADEALAAARPAVAWLDRPERPPAGEPLGADATVDLLVVGAGYTGLWAALLAAERDPGRWIAVIDAGRVGGQASGRNGGFCSASLTHGVANGAERFPAELARLQQLGWDNLDAIEAALDRHGIDCSFERTGNLVLATAPWQLRDLRSACDQEADAGEDVTWLDAAALRAEVDSPTYHGGYWRRSGEAMVDPARLAWGLAAACRRLGVEVHEATALAGLESARGGVDVRTTIGRRIRAQRVVVATGAFPSPIRRIRRLVAPVYDHVLMTEPLSREQLASVGWAHRQGISDATNLFHYSRLTDDHSAQGGEGPRILWGGYDAVYHFGNRIGPALEQRDATHRLLARQFFETYPQLEGLRFAHRWGGVIDTCSRFAVTFGTALDGRVAYAVGYTGLGVGASRFGAQVCLDLLDRPDSELLDLELVRRGPIPFPPEPLRWIGITATRRALERADRRDGRRGPWLRLLDRIGLGFDS
jgi:glycine/D-amino acid oxidase-like deaminating enzyme